MPTPKPKANRIRERKRRWLTVTLLTTVALVGGGVAAAVFTGRGPFSIDSKDRKEVASENVELPVVIAKVVRPKKESTVSITMDQIASVEPYYRADLRARASGLVKSVYFDIGEKVREGEVLILIDVPESDQDVSRCEAMILQKQQELKVSEAKLQDAKAGKDVSAATIKQKLADVQAATATRDLRKRKFERFQSLAERGSVVGSIVEEEERDFLASEANVSAANANVERARADFAESESKIDAAEADIQLKIAQVEVARKDLDRAKAILNYGKIIAPFDGVVVRRSVDPGSFVQNATTGSSEVLISIAKVDLVTVSAKFPDSVAPSIQSGMPALVTIDDLPGVTISAKVTRFAPTLQNADRTMRIEVDLFNGDETDYQRLTQAPGSSRFSKGSSDTIPVRAFPADTPNSRRLIPGMTGSIKLTIGNFGDSYLLPSVCVYSRSGVSYILVVEDGLTKELPVRVQLNDGKNVLIAIITNRQQGDGVRSEVYTELSGDEQVVVARQLEIGTGTPVKCGLSDW
jgi:multidrug resistance efflux pump